MIVKKKPNTYNTYTLENVSFGELIAIRDALVEKGSDSLTDEMAAAINWSLENIPLPGEDETDLKDRKDAEEDAENPENKPKATASDIEHEASVYDELPEPPAE